MKILNYIYFFRFEFFFNPLYTKENKETTKGLQISLQFLYNKKFETTLLTKKESNDTLRILNYGLCHHTTILENVTFTA